MMRWVVVASMCAAAIVASCGDAETASPCRDIPAGGCPISRGVACSDPACLAVYACRPGNVWELERTCPAQADATTTTPDAASQDRDAGERDARHAPEGAYGGPGCVSLQMPDCSVGVALACPSGCCGCEDLFACEAGGWVLRGRCGDAGISLP